jgi:hypothetical protein
VLRDRQLAELVERDADVGNRDVRQLVVLEHVRELDLVDDEVHAVDRVSRHAVRGDVERLERAEVAGHLTELVSDVANRHDEVGRDLEQTVVEVARDERNRALEDVLERAVGELGDELVEDPVRRIVAAVGGCDECIRHLAGGAGHVGGDVEVALQRELAFGGERRLRLRAGAAATTRAVRHVRGVGGTADHGRAERESEGDG